MAIQFPNAQEVLNAFESAISFQPSSLSWGFFAYDDAPGGIGGGSGAFCWFDSQSKALDFLCKYPLLAQSDSAIEDEICRSKFLKIQDTLRSLQEIDDVALRRINAELKGIEQIVWFGRFDELCIGDSIFAKNVRQNFFENSVDEHVSEADTAAFSRFLQEWSS